MTPGDQGPAFSWCKLLFTWHSKEKENRAAFQAIENNFADTTYLRPQQLTSLSFRLSLTSADMIWETALPHGATMLSTVPS